MLPTIRRRNYSPVFFSDLFNSDLFNNEFNNSFYRTRYSEPAVNIREDEKRYNIELAVAGMNKDEMKIEIEKDTLIVSSEKKEQMEESKNGYSIREFGDQSFCKSFRIPEGTDTSKIKASYNDGILDIEIPKVEEKARVNKVIKIS